MSLWWLEELDAQMAGAFHSCEPRFPEEGGGLLSGCLYKCGHIFIYFYLLRGIPRQREREKETKVNNTRQDMNRQMK